MANSIKDLDIGYKEWNELIDTEKRLCSLRTENDIGKHFNIPTSCLSSIRSNDRPLGTQLAVKLLCKVQRPLTFNMLLAMIRKDHLEAILFTLKAGRKICVNLEVFDSLLDVCGKKINWDKAIEMLTAKYSCESTKEITDLMGIYPSSLSTYRDARGELSGVAKTNTFFKLKIPLNEETIVHTLSDELFTALEDNKIVFKWTENSLNRSCNEILEKARA